MQYSSLSWTNITLDFDPPLYNHSPKPQYYVIYILIRSLLIPPELLYYKRYIEEN